MGRKLVVFAVVIIAVATIFALDLDRYVSFNFLTSNIEKLRRLFELYPVIFGLSFFALYVVCTALSIPVATVLTLAAGAIFGLWYGTVIVSFAASIGATFAFMISRYVLRDYVLEKFAAAMTKIDKGIKDEGRFYLFALRLVPIVPFFVVNLIMGLTAMNAGTFYWVSQVGMLVATIIYVNAGVHLAQINHLSEILRLDVVASLTVLGLLPLASRHIIDRLRRRRVYAPYRKQKPRHFDYDLVVIGAGSAGLVTAYIASSIKAKVLLVEKNKMGGDCLNTGCVPSKALIRAAHLVHDAKRCQQFGINRMTVDFSLSDVMKRVHNVIKAIEPHDSIDRYTSLGVDVMHGTAMLTSPWSVDVDGHYYTTRAITLACGAEPFIPPIEGINTIDYLTSENLWSLSELPRRLLVLGGGPIGCELAQAFARLGARVTLVEMDERLLRAEDIDVSSFVAQALTTDGVEVLTSHKATRFARGTDGDILTCEIAGDKKEIIFDKALIAVGRKARIAGYGMSELGIQLRKNGTIDVNEYLETKYPNIFACGDVTGPYQFTHTASHQAWYCAVNALFGGIKKFAVDYRVIPWCTYTDPEIATVGLTEAAAQKAGIAYELVRYPLNDLDRAIIDGTDYGFIQVITAEKSDRILGATVVSKDASNLILEFVTAMKYGLGLRKILSTIHIYPSLGEANKYAAGNWQKAHVPTRALTLLARYFAWQRSDDKTTYR